MVVTMMIAKESLVVNMTFKWKDPEDERGGLIL